MTWTSPDVFSKNSVTSQDLDEGLHISLTKTRNNCGLVRTPFPYFPIPKFSHVLLLLLDLESSLCQYHCRNNICLKQQVLYLLLKISQKKIGIRMQGCGQISWKVLSNSVITHVRRVKFSPGARKGPFWSARRSSCTDLGRVKRKFHSFLFYDLCFLFNH